jgi:hypothetical protein
MLRPLLAALLSVSVALPVGAQAGDPCEEAVKADLRQWSDAGGLDGAALVAAVASWKEVCGDRLGAAPAQAEAAAAPSAGARILSECDGVGSTIFGWRWRLTSIFTPDLEVPDAAVQGSWGRDGLLGATRGAIGQTTIASGGAVIFIGPVPFVGWGSVDPTCQDVPGLGKVPINAEFSVTSNLLSHFVQLEGDGIVCAIPC